MTMNLDLFGRDLFDQPVAAPAHGSLLAEDFLLPPFSVLNARERWWQERKAAWLRMGIQSEVGRGPNLIRHSRTTTLGEKDSSIFDPVLCELVYRWFSPPGGLVLDNFAGGSVRGVVAAALGRRYYGIELRPEQIASNEEQARAILAPSPAVETHGRLTVVQDAATPGGTKQRALLRFIGAYPERALVYASPASGFAQIALAAACREVGKRALIFVAKRKTHQNVLVFVKGDWRRAAKACADEATP